MRDDIGKLPIPASAKAYARRKGLLSMLRQPRDYIQMVADVTGQPVKGFRNKDASETTSGRVIEAMLSEAPKTKRPKYNTPLGKRPLRADSPFSADLEATEPDAAEQEANEWLTAHADEIAKKMVEVGATGYEAVIVPRTLNDPNADIFKHPVSKLRQFRKRKAVWVKKADHPSPDGYFLEVGWIGVFGPENPDTTAHDLTQEFKEQRLHEACAAASRWLDNEKRQINDKIRSYRSDGYTAELHSNDTDQLVATLKQKVGERQHRWDMKVGGATTSSTGYVMYLDITGAYDSDYGWDATKRLAKTAADVAQWAVS